MTYRGHLIAKESGTQNHPIVLTVDPGWGEGEAVLAGSTALIGGWHRCSKKEADILPDASKNRTWCRDIYTKDQPRALWEISDKTITRIPMARTPNWKVSVPHDPRYEWRELKAAVALVEITFAGGHEFKVGDSVWDASTRKFSDQLNSSDGFKVVEVNNNSITIEIPDGKGSELSRWDVITNGDVEEKIKEMSGGKQTRWNLKGDFSPISSDTQLKNLVIWAERAHIPISLAATVDEFNSDEGVLSANLDVAAGKGPTLFSRYYLEGAADFLDQAGEFHFERTSGVAGRLYVRLPGDRDPNGSVLELANLHKILEIRNQNYIQLSGLTFRFSNQLQPGTREARNAALFASAIQIRGSVEGIQIDHCRFDNVATGIVVYPIANGQPDRLDYITIADNVFADIDGQAVSLGNSADRRWFRAADSRLVHVTVSRNKLDRIGLQALGHFNLGSLGHGIDINGAEVVEVDGNHVNYVGGSGISVITGSYYDNGGISRPFLRTLIHHNKVTNSLLRVQDYGGIAAWLGGPSYIYNNISGNPVGYRHSERLIDQRIPEYRRGNYRIGHLPGRSIQRICF